MNIEDITLSGNLKLKDLSWLIESNEATAKIMDVRLSWGYLQGKVYGRVIEGEQVLFHRYYEKQYVHICLAWMQIDFERFLKELDRKRKAARPKEPEDDRPFHIRRGEGKQEEKDSQAAEAAKDIENDDYGVDREYED